MQHDRLTQAELDRMPAKTKLNPEATALYLEHDFLTAYAKHTDIRVAESPKGAIGNHLEWETHGEWQREFLISQWLKPHNTLLEIGCGTGRLARKVVPYLEARGYHGVDISKGAIDSCWACAKAEGWADRLPRFYSDIDLVPSGPFDFIWAFSVFIHLPAEVMRQVFRSCAQRMNVASRFYFSYVPEKVEARTGLKQFRHELDTYKTACKEAGLSFRDVPWSHQQRIGLALKC